MASLLNKQTNRQINQTHLHIADIQSVNIRKRKTWNQKGKVT